MRRICFLSAIIFGIIICCRFTVADGNALAQVEPGSKPEDLKSYYIDNLSFKIPSFRTVAYVNWLPMSQKETISFREFEFPESSDADAIFKMACEESLKYELHDKDIDTTVLVKEIEASETGYPSYFTVTKSLGSDDSLYKYYVNLHLLLKMPSAYLEFNWPAATNSDFSALSPKAALDIFQQQVEKEFISWIKSFMFSYKWAGRQFISVGQNYRTPFGLIEREYGGFPVSSSITASNSFHDAGGMVGVGDDLIISTGFQYNGYSIYRGLLSTFFSYNQADSSAKPLVLALRDVAGRHGLEMIYIDSEAKTCRLAWLEFVYPAVQARAPLVIRWHMLMYGIKDEDKRKELCQGKLKQWNYILNSVQSSPSGSD